MGQTARYIPSFGPTTTRLTPLGVVRLHHRNEMTALSIINHGTKWHRMPPGGEYGEYTSSQITVLLLTMFIFPESNHEAEVKY